MKRILSVFLALTVLCSAFCAGMIQAGASSIIWTETSNSTNITIYSDNALVVSGTGDMSDYSLNSRGQTTAPWFFVTQFGLTPKILFAEGVTSVGAYAFYLPETGSYNVHLINLSSTIKTIGQYAFGNIKKLKMISIPSSVTTIDNNAFSGCNNIVTVKCFAEPTNGLNLNNIGLPDNVKIRVLPEKLEDFKKTFPALASKFVGDLVPLAEKPANGKIEVVHYDRDNSIFGGVLATSIKANPYGDSDSNHTAPITYGASGFPCCIRITDSNGDFKYYGLDQNDGTLHRLTLVRPETDVGGQKGKEVGAVSSINTSETFNDLSLKLSYQYIGLDAVKVIYSVKNETQEPISFKLGGAGDIKIGTDDNASIVPLMNNNRQIGITMTSQKTDDTDKDADQNPLTLGFIAKEVGGSSSDAKFFYGQVDSTWTKTATGVCQYFFNPFRVFEMNPGGIVPGSESDPITAFKSYTSNEFNENKDSGISYYWDVNLSGNESKDYAVIFTVFGTSNDDKSSEVVNNVTDDIDDEPDYVIPIDTRVFFDDEITVDQADTLAQANNYNSLRNFLLLGVQRKFTDYTNPDQNESTTHMRFVSVAKTGLLAHAEEYGYLVAKTSLEYSAARAKIDQLQYESPNVVKINCKGTNNSISGDFGKYESHNSSDSYNTPYKYVTLALDNVPVGITVMTRFYIKNGGKVYYADYYNKDKDKFDGCASAWADLTKA